MASLASLKGSGEGGSSPLMMDRQRRGDHNQGSYRDDDSDDKRQQLQRNEEEHEREATDGIITPPNQESNNISGCTTGETVASSSPALRVKTSQNQLQAGIQSPASLSRIQQNSRRSILSGSTTGESGGTRQPPLQRERNELPHQSLIASQQEIQEALERCDSISLNYFTCLDGRKREALEALSAALSTALNPANSSSSNESEEEVLSKITAAKEACEIEDSEEVTPMANNEVLLEEQEDEESNLPQQLIAQSAKQLEDCRRIKNKILSDIVPYNHYDPLHPIVLINNTLTDGIQFPLILPRAFPTVKFDDCVRAGLAANLVSAFVASPYLQAQLLQRVPRYSHPAIRNIDGVTRQLLDIPYVFYYVPGWYELKLGTLSRIAGLFILPSAIARKLTWRFFQSKLYRGSLEQRAAELTSHPRMTPILLAFKDALERFGPDIVAAITRSFCSNLLDYNQGTISAEEVYTKTRWSAGVYTIATIGFYTFYRILEAVIIRTQMRAAGSYQDFAHTDLQKVEHLKKSLSDLESPSSSSRSLVDSPLQCDRVTSTIQHLTDARVDSLSHTLKFLDSPVTNLMSDPFYRWSFGNDQNAIDSFRVLDALKFLRTMLPSLKSANVPEQQQAYAALATLRNYLITNADRGDIGSRNDTKNTLQNWHAPLSRFIKDEHYSLPQNKIDSLIAFFKKFSKPPTPSGPGSLLGVTRYPIYNAVNQDAVSKVKCNTLL
ncbi:MAG: hypothetical protein NT164_04755 [Verrucomicrobiae bacterium]|nr:hypothetical protein [Verrucomicrobiae bacterium]